MYTGSQIPYVSEKKDKAGRVLHKAHVPSYPHPSSDYELFDNFVFPAKIQVLSIRRGMAAANYRVVILPAKDTPEFLRDTECTMFMRDMLDIIQHEGIASGGYISGLFCFCKRGDNYGIQRYSG